MRLRLRTASLILIIVAAASALLAQKLKELKPASSVENIPKAKDIEIGRKVAAEAEQQYPVINNPELQAFVDRIVKTLGTQPAADGYPYTIKPIYDDSINAFAYPGGAMFIHTGLIKAADNEDQIAGVLGHEMAHVALRHGMAGMVRAQKTQTIAGIGGALAGIFLGGGALGSLAQAGIGLSAQSVLLKNTRDAETQADLLGTRMMNEAGYNPIEMARFFEKLEGDGGSRAPQFFSDHPNPGNRVKSVEDEIQLLPRATYNAARPQEFQRAKAVVGTLKAPPKKTSSKGAPARTGGDGPTGQVGQGANGFKRYTGQVFQMDFPGQWQVFGGQGADAVTIGPQNGVNPDNGSVSAGVVVNAAKKQGNLANSTRAIIQGFQKNDANMKVGESRNIQVSGRQGILTTMQSTSPQGGREMDYLLTVDLPDRTFFAVFVAPEAQAQQAQPVFQQMIQSLRFAQ